MALREKGRREKGRERERERKREREREKHQSVVSSMGPEWGSILQPRYGP